jgi:hypothetical protein
VTAVGASAGGVTQGDVRSPGFLPFSLWRFAPTAVPRKEAGAPVQGLLRRVGRRHSCSFAVRDRSSLVGSEDFENLVRWWRRSQRRKRQPVEIEVGFKVWLRATGLELRARAAAGCPCAFRGQRGQSESMALVEYEGKSRLVCYLSGKDDCEKGTGALIFGRSSPAILIGPDGRPE